MKRDRRGLQLLSGYGHSSSDLPLPRPSINVDQAPHDHHSERIVGYLNQLMCEIQRLIDGMDRAATGEFDLTAELRALQEAYEGMGSTRIILAIHPAAIEVLTQQEAREMLQIVREMLGNCVRSQATQATVSIRKRGARICLRICDNGAGFVMADGRSQSDRVAAIESRARKIGGTVRTRVEAGRGAQLLVEFSLEPVLVLV